MAAISMKEIERNKKETSIKSMYFNRYLGVRYALAFFFFSNLYWLLALLMSHSNAAILPAINLLTSLFAMYEQVKIFSSHTSNAKAAKLTFMTFTLINVLTLVLIWIPNMFKYLYPFINVSTQNKMVVSLMLLFGLALLILVIKKLNRIQHEKDKQFQRVKRYEKLIK